MMTYSHREVKWLVEHYQDYLNPAVNWNPEFVHKFVDLKRSYINLSTSTREILFMCGVMGMDKITVGWITDMHRSTVYRQYKEGLRSLTALMNGQGGDYGEQEQSNYGTDSFHEDHKWDDERTYRRAT